MLIKTEAICIKNTRFGESSVISKLFTLEYGLSSFIIQGINKKSSLIKPSHISPGNLIEIVIYQKPNTSIQRIKELKVQFPLFQVHINMVKNSILQFILEIIAKTNEDNFKDETVFYFLRNNIKELDQTDENLGTFPLLFLGKYLSFSGWFPNIEYWRDGFIFNLTEGTFEFPKEAVSSSEIADLIISKALFDLLTKIKMNSEIKIEDIRYRKDLFKILLNYYETHVLKGKKIKSPAILTEILG